MKHSTKIRLKELKQREFARNVASKSWKDEKKQEKALKRLHQLAELRKQPDCVSDGGPIFKGPILRGPQEAFFTSQDGRITGSRCTVVCKGEPVSNSSITENKQDMLFGSDVLNNGRCCFVGNQSQLPFSNGINVNNRAGVSFCFSKKALVKLDSSASVFNENTEEANECNQYLRHKAKQMSVSFRHYAHIDENTRENSELILQHETDNSMQGKMPANMETLKDPDNSPNETKEINGIAQTNIKAKTQSSDMSNTDALNKTEEVNVSVTPEVILETSESIHCPSKKCYLQHNSSNEHTVTDTVLTEHVAEDLKKNHGEEELSTNANVEHLDSCHESVQNSSNCLEAPVSESLNNNAQANAMPFLNVLSKDGSTNLQWPTELLLFTKTEPSISYACNPLYFDFKCSRKNSVKKANERATKNCEEHDQSKTTTGKRASGISTDRELEIEKDSQSQRPKREKRLLDEMFKKDCKSSNNYSITKEFTQKANLKNLHENTAQASTHISTSQKYIFKENNHARKRKRSFNAWLDNSTECLHSRAEDYNSLSKEVTKRKYVKSLHNEPLYMKDKNEHMNRSNSNENQCKDYNCINQNESDFSLDASSDKSDSKSKESDSESDGSSFKCWGSSSSQMSPCDKLPMHSDSSFVSGSTCTQTRDQPSHKVCLRRGTCVTRKHNCEMFCDNECISYVSDKKLKYKCRTLKHKPVRDRSKYESPDHQVCSRRIKNEHRSRKKYKGFMKDHNSESSHSRQASSTQKTTSTISSNSTGLSKERTYSMGTHSIPHNSDSFHTTEARETSYKCYSQNIISLSDKCSERSSENIVKHIIVKKKKTLIAELLLERGPSTKKVEKDSTSREFPEGCGMKVNNHSQSYFAVKFPASAHGSTILPLLKNVNASSKNGGSYGRDHTVGNGISNKQTEETQGYEVTVTTNANKCLYEDIIHVGTECQTLNTEIPVYVGEQSRQLISEVQPFMQSSDPVHLNFSCALPSLRHSGGASSPETKEEQKRLEQYDVNMKISPVDGNGKFFYDNTMQDYSKTENNQRVYHKSTSPPLTQQPITFTPDEVDKYRLLQLQAQQHMQKQHLSKHFKTLPTSRSPVFATAQAIQPVSVAQHPSITSIHHALMQRYAVTAAMHSQVNHLPLPHLNAFPQSPFPPITISSLAPAVIPAHPTFLTGHPLHIVSAAAIHPAQLTIQAFPHAALIPTIFTPHPTTGMHPAIHLHPLFHPLFQGQDFHHLSA